MLHLIVLTLFGLVLVLGQGKLPEMAFRPNLSIIITIYAGQFYPPIAGLLISFSLGYFVDLMSGGLLGLNAFSMVTVGYLSYLLGKRIFVQNRLTQAMVVFSFYIFYGLTVYLLFRFFNIDASGLEYSVKTFWDGVAASILSLPVISAIRRMERLFRFRNERMAVRDARR